MDLHVCRVRGGPLGGQLEGGRSRSPEPGGAERFLQGVRRDAHRCETGDDTLFQGAQNIQERSSESDTGFWNQEREVGEDQERFFSGDGGEQLDTEAGTSSCFVHGARFAGLDGEPQVSFRPPPGLPPPEQDELKEDEWIQELQRQLDLQDEVDDDEWVHELQQQLDLHDEVNDDSRPADRQLQSNEAFRHSQGKNINAEGRFTASVATPKQNGSSFTASVAVPEHIEGAGAMLDLNGPRHDTSDTNRSSSSWEAPGGPGVAGGGPGGACPPDCGGGSSGSSSNTAFTTVSMPPQATLTAKALRTFGPAINNVLNSKYVKKHFNLSKRVSGMGTK